MPPPATPGWILGRAPSLSHAGLGTWGSTRGLPGGGTPALGVRAPPGHGGCCHGAAWGCVPPPPQHPILAPSRQERAGEAGDKTCSWGSPPLHSGTRALPCLSLFGDVPACWGTSDQEGAKDGDPPGCPSSNQAVLAPRLCSYPDGCVRQLGGRGQSLPGGGVRVLPPPKLCKGAGVQSAPALG